MTELPITIPSLEIHVTHACNLHCDGCSHYTNYGFKSGITLAEFCSWLASWKDRIAPRQVKLLGGEPTLLPNLADYIRATREAWPECRLLLTTNGSFVHRHPNLPETLKRHRCGVHFSVHDRTPDFVSKIAAGLELLEATCRTNDLPFMLSTDSGWVRHYNGVGREMRPFADGDAKLSWRNCAARTCMNLADNRLYKCPQLAYLPLAAAQFKLDREPEWAPYLAYEGLGPECSTLELKAFLQRTAGPESVCAMCPAHPEPYEKDIHNVNFDRPGERRVEAARS